MDEVERLAPGLAGKFVDIYNFFSHAAKPDWLTRISPVYQAALDWVAISPVPFWDGRLTACERRAKPLKRQCNRWPGPAGAEGGRGRGAVEGITTVTLRRGRCFDSITLNGLPQILEIRELDELIVRHDPFQLFYVFFLCRAECIRIDLNHRLHHRFEMPFFVL